MSYSLNPDAQEFTIFVGSNAKPSTQIVPSWNTFATDFIPFTESTPPPPPVIIPKAPSPPKVKTYTFEVLLSLKDQYKTLPEGVIIPDFYQKNHHSKSKNSKKGPPPPKSSGIKRAENQLNSLSILVKTEKPFTEKVKKQADEQEKKSREIRCILNKLTEKNFEKLISELTNIEYNENLLGSLTNFIFERATAMNFPDLYAKLCQALRQKFKDKNLSTKFRKSIVEKCRECFYNEDMPMENDKLMEAEFKRRRRLIGNIKFIALLHKARMIKSEIMFECFDVLLEPKSLSDETLETCVTLFKDTCPILVASNTNQIVKYYERLVSMKEDPRFCKRIFFMIQDLIDFRDQIMTPRAFKTQSVSARPPPPPVPVEIDEVDLEENTKSQIREVTRIYISYAADEDDWKPRLEAIFTEHGKLKAELIIQILKYGLYEYVKVEHILQVCEFVKYILRAYKLDQGVIDRAFRAIDKDLSEIIIDSPHASEMYEIMKKTFSG